MAQTAVYQAPAQDLLFEVVHNEFKNGRAERYGVVTVPSSDGKREYRVDVSNGRCSCPAWKFQKGHAKPCKHLKALGFVEQPKPKFEVEL